MILNTISSKEEYTETFLKLTEEICLKRIEEIITNTLYAQLNYDGITIEFEHLQEMLGSFVFLPTDNDRSTTGFQNQRLYDLDWWKDDYENLESMPIIELTSRMNKGSIRIGKGCRAYTDSVEEMKKNDRIVRLKSAST